VSWQKASVFAIALGLAAGCAEHLRAISRTGGFSTGVFFWPPPPSTSSWIGEPSRFATFRDAAEVVAATLGRAGYHEQRLLPIGANYEHGFAVTTRLEHIDEHGAPRPPGDRWVLPFPDAASLRWLAGSAETYLPAKGRYRVFFVAFTDLQPPLRGARERWDEETAMDGPDLKAPALPVHRRVRAGFRIGVYVYEYEARSSDGQGRLLFTDPDVAAAAHMERSGLRALMATTRSAAEW
jgi:hypothetical protein